MSLEGIRSFSAVLPMKYRVVIFLAAVLLIPGGSALLAHADDHAQADEVKVVTPPGSSQDARLDEALAQVASATRRILESQAQLAGRDAEYARLLDDLRMINTNATTRRAELDLVFKSKPSWLAADQVRREAFATLQQARQNEQAQQRNMASADASGRAVPGGEQKTAEQAWIAAVDARQQAQTALDQAEQSLLRVQHQLSYEDPDGQRLRAEIKRLEADLLQVRQAKAVREKLDAPWRTADAQRRRAYAALKEAQWQAQMARKELGNADGKADGTPAVEAENP
jgi:chromosome segregation ATPase